MASGFVYERIHRSDSEVIAIRIIINFDEIRKISYQTHPNFLSLMPCFAFGFRTRREFQIIRKLSNKNKFSFFSNR